jgi:hypothetical protein
MISATLCAIRQPSQTSTHSAWTTDDYDGGDPAGAGGLREGGSAGRRFLYFRERVCRMQAGPSFHLLRIV